MVSYVDPKEPHEYFVKDLYSNIVEALEQVRNNLLEAMDKLKSNTSENGEASIPATSLAKLPRKQLPTFNGEPTAWSSFRDHFTSLVHGREDLSPIQKLHYVKELLAIPSVGRNCSADLANLRNRAINCYKAIQDLKLPIAMWEDNFLHSIITKLDAATAEAWELELKDANSLPTFKQFTDFLAIRIGATAKFSSTSSAKQTYEVSKLTSHEDAEFTGPYNIKVVNGEIVSIEPPATCPEIGFLINFPSGARECFFNLDQFTRCNRLSASAELRARITEERTPERRQALTEWTTGVKAKEFQWVRSTMDNQPPTPMMMKSQEVEKMFQVFDGCISRPHMPWLTKF